MNFDDLDLFQNIPEETTESKALNLKELRQLCLGFVGSLLPDALAADVPSRNKRSPVTAAGFFAGRKGVTQTVIAVLYTKREHCFNECVKTQKMLDKIKALTQDKLSLESEIRLREPELASTDDLFTQFRLWNYRASTNLDYHKVCEKIRKLQEILHNGSKLNYISGNQLADRCYLAVPELLICPEEIMPDWGLVYLRTDGSFQIVKEAPYLDSPPEQRTKLGLKIARAASAAVKFAHGLELTPDLLKIRRIPRKRTVLHDIALGAE